MNDKFGTHYTYDGSLNMTDTDLEKRAKAYHIEKQCCLQNTMSVEDISGQKITPKKTENEWGCYVHTIGMEILQK